ncbi:MAG: hypothetical protein KC621_17785 [Myxococcales bacterium]|nr:hypothetical protein [Myxococcales bacterium]
MSTVLASLALGAAAGLLVGYAAPLPARTEALEPTRAERAEVVRTATKPCPDMDAPAQEALDEAWRAREAAEQALRAIEEDLEAFMGAPGTFADYPDALRPEQLEETVDRLLDHEHAELQWVDCAEAPCIAVLRLIGADRQELVGMRAGAEPLQDGLDVDLGFEWVGLGDDTAYLTVPLGPDGLPDTLEHRVDVREEAILAELAAGVP